MADDVRTPSTTTTLSPAPKPPEEGVNRGRRGLAGMLALFGGGAAVGAACADGAGGGGGFEIIRSAQAATGTASAASGDAIFWADTIAEMRAQNGGASHLAVAVVMGAAAVSDGGGGVFRWIGLAAAPPSTLEDGGINVVPSTQSPAGYWKRQYDGPIDMRWFLAAVPNLHTGTEDWSGVIAKALAVLQRDDATHTENVLYFPRRSYQIMAGIVVTQSGVHLRGDGIGATSLYLAPPVGGDGGYIPTDLTALEFRGGAGANQRIYGCSVRDLSFTTTPSSSVAKTAIQLTNCDTCDVTDVEVVNNWVGNRTTPPNVGIKVLAGQQCRIVRVQVVADAPVQLLRNAIATGEGVIPTQNVDLLHLHDVILSCEYVDNASLSHGACFFIDEGVYVSNLVIDGCNWFGNGKWGIRWLADQPASGSDPGWAHFSALFSNIRFEGQRANDTIDGGDPGHEIDIRAGYSSRALARSSVINLIIRNVVCEHTPDTPDSIFLQGVQGRVVDSQIEGSAKGIEVRPNLNVQATGPYTDVVCEGCSISPAAAPSGATHVDRFRGGLESNVGTGIAQAITPLCAAGGAPHYKRAIVTISAFDETDGTGSTPYSTTGSVCQGGSWLVTPAGARKLSGTSKIGVINSTGAYTVPDDTLCLLCFSNHAVYLVHALRDETVTSSPPHVGRIAYTLTIEYSS